MSRIEKAARAYVAALLRTGFVDDEWLELEAALAAPPEPPSWGELSDPEYATRRLEEMRKQRDEAWRERDDAREELARARAQIGTPSETAADEIRILKSAAIGSQETIDRLTKERDAAIAEANANQSRAEVADSRAEVAERMLDSARRFTSTALARAEKVESELQAAKVSPPLKGESARSFAARGGALDGADAKALEHALTITERERDEARAERDAAIGRLEARGGHALEAREAEKSTACICGRPCDLCGARSA